MTRAGVGTARPIAEDGGDDGLAPLLNRNRAWAERKTQVDPAFFHRLVGQQNPAYFWIGCSDSRVPATEIVDLDPGEMFVHRNAANLARADDPNFAAALLFAVEVLQVKQIIVVGHYGCGGVRAAMSNERTDAIGTWLEPVVRLHRRQPAGTQHADRLCELNVIEQVDLLAANPITRDAWARNSDLRLHGWVYAIGNGLLRQLCGPISAAG